MFNELNTAIASVMGPFGLIIILGALGLILVLVTVVMMVNQPEDPLDKLKRDQTMCRKTAGDGPATLRQKDGNAQVQSSAFIGPAGVGEMNNVKYQSFVNDAYAAVSTRKALVGGTYYDDSWMVMSLLMMTGNFLDYTTY